MTFSESVSPDITEDLPAPLSGQKNDAATEMSRGRVRWDISLDGIGFVLGIDDQHPYMRESAPVQKQQTDTSGEAGEQTLDGLWIRSQTSWHLGAGARFYEPGTKTGATPSQYRYDRSVGVDVWSEGDLSLLKATALTQAASTSECYATGARVSGADVLFTQCDGVVKRWTAAGAATSYTPSAVAPTGRVALAGSKILVGATGVGIDAGDTGGSVLTRLYNQAAGTTPVPYWAKGRIIATKGREVHELALDGSSNAGTIAAPTVIYTHPDPNWVWTSVTETPDSVLLSGYANGLSAIYALTLETNSGGLTPKLGQPFQVAEFPPGEEARSILVYLGTYIGIGTTRGLRVGIVGNSGKIQYGPVLIETAQPVQALAARDAYLYAAVTNEISGNSGAVRVDLGHQITDGLLFPWAYDAQAHVTGTAGSIAFVGTSDRVAVGVSSSGVYTQSATVYEPSGTLTSGRVRYGTTEAKAFRYADVRCHTASDSAVGLSLIGPTDEEITLVSLSNGASGSNLSLASVAQRLEYVAYKLTLTRSTDTLSSPTVESVALKAVPAVKKQRLIQYPVKMEERQHDSVKTPFQQDIPDLIERIEDLEESRAVIQVNDYRTGESFPASIESFQFTGTTPATGTKRGGNNVGGRGTITVRKLS